MVHSFHTDNSSDLFHGESVFRDISLHNGTPDKKEDLPSYQDVPESDDILDETGYQRVSDLEGNSEEYYDEGDDLEDCE